MKIAILSSGFMPVVDGVSIALLNRLQNLDRLGHEVLLLCPDYSTINFIYPNWQDYTGQIFSNVRVVSLSSTPFLDLELERNVSIQSYKTVLQELQIFQPDIVHVDEPERLWLGFLRRPGIKFAKKNKIPCVSFFHTNFLEYIEDYVPLPSPIIKIIQFMIKYHRNWIYNSYDAILVSSPSTTRKVFKLGFKNIININLLGVDFNKYQIALRNKDFFANYYNLADIHEKIKIIFLGRLNPEKGWKFTIEALLNFGLSMDFTDIAFIIVGDGSMKEEIRQKLGQLTSNTYYLGRVLPDAIPALLINSDIHVTTSEKETTGLTILEAQAAGIPVLAPRAEGMVDSIQDGNNGLLFKPQDKRDFVEKLNLLCVDRSLRERLGTQAREDIRRCSWEQATKNLLDIWEQQILNHREPTRSMMRSK